MAVVTTLSFAGRTEEALEFYREAMGAEITFLMRFQECPDPLLVESGEGDMIFHATFRIHGTELMASDVGHTDFAVKPIFKGFALAILLEAADQARSIFNALSDGGIIVIPLDESTFSKMYGIVTDRFGVTWKINVR
jgi:PhnB protein